MSMFEDDYEVYALIKKHKISSDKFNQMEYDRKFMTTDDFAGEHEISAEEFDMLVDWAYGNLSDTQTLDYITEAK